MEENLIQTIGLCFAAPVIFAMLLSSFKFIGTGSKLSLLVIFTAIIGGFWYFNGGF